jgi:hypothetical protein
MSRRVVLLFAIVKHASHYVGTEVLEMRLENVADWLEATDAE